MIVSLGKKKKKPKNDGINWSFKETHSFDKIDF